MSNKYNICISYAATDNMSSDKGQTGWVTNFQQFLEKMLNRIFEEKLNFFKYTEHDNLSSEQLAKADIFICILSPQYIQSIVCQKNIEQIASLVCQEDVENQYIRKRLLKIVKYPVDADYQPASIRHLPNYNIHYAASISGQAKEVSNFFEMETKKELWLELADLTYDIHEILLSSKSAVQPSTENSLASSNAVFLAETGTELLVERHIIKRELQRHGYRVLPEQKLPSDIKAMEVAVRKDLETCKLSIHLVGDSYGEILDSTGYSIIELQNKFAVEHCKAQTTAFKQPNKDPAFSRLIWFSPRNESTNENNQEILHKIGRHTEALAGAEVFQTSLESFKSAIWEELVETSGNKNERQLVRKIHQPRIYIIYEKSDSAAITSLLNVLQHKELNFTKPLFEGDLLHIRHQHLQQLATADVIILYKNNVNEQWLRMKALDVLKAPGYNRGKPIFDKAVVTGRGTELDTTFYEANGFTLIKDYESYLGTLLAHFAAQMQERHG